MCLETEFREVCLCLKCTVLEFCYNPFTYLGANAFHSISLIMGICISMMLYMYLSLEYNCPDQVHERGENHWYHDKYSGIALAIYCGWHKFLTILMCLKTRAHNIEWQSLYWCGNKGIAKTNKQIGDKTQDVSVAREMWNNISWGLDDHELSMQWLIMTCVGYMPSRKEHSHYQN